MPKAATKSKTTKKAAKAKISFAKLQRLILYVSDWKRAIRFYTETLGIPLAYTDGDCWAGLATKGMEVNLHSGRTKKVGEESPYLGLAVSDFDAAYAELQARGVKMSKIFSPCPGTRCANFKDPDGNNLGIEGA